MSTSPPTPDDSNHHSKDSHRLHALIMKYCAESDTGTSDQIFNTRLSPLLTTLVEKNPRALLEKSITGITHLNATLSLLSKNNSGNDFSLRRKKAKDFTDAFLKALDKAVALNKLSNKDIADFLTTPTDKNFTTLHCAIKIGDIETYHQLEQKLNALREGKIIGDKEYAQQFILPTIDDFTSLDNAVITGNVEMYKLVVGKLDALHNDKIIDDKEYAQQFTLPTTHDLTGLCHAVMTGNVEMYKLVVKKLDALCEGKLIDDKEYARQFILPTKGDFTVLNHAVMTGNVEMYKQVAEKLGALYEAKTIDKKQYAQQFILPTTDDFTVLHHAVKANNIEMYTRVVEKLEALRTNQVITDKEYAKQFTLPTKSQSIIPLFNAITSGNVDLFKAFVGDLKQALKQAYPETWKLGYQNQLKHHSELRWNVFHCATVNDADKGTPNPELILALQDEFFLSFGNGNLYGKNENGKRGVGYNHAAAERIRGLCAEETSGGYPAFNKDFHQGTWVQRMLELTDNEDLKIRPTQKR